MHVLVFECAAQSWLSMETLNFHKENHLRLQEII
jgi:hypothetical protein